MEHLDNTPAVEEKRRRRSIYILPSLFTTANLFAGFYAIVQSMNGNFEHAPLAIFIAMILDALDGRIARMTHTESDFGAQYDSLVDMISFGLAPALIIYEWALAGMGNLGWLAAFIFTAGAGLRLARFNTQVGVADKRFFRGLPSPAAAALVAGFVWVLHVNGVPGKEISIAALRPEIGKIQHPGRGGRQALFSRPAQPGRSGPGGGFRLGAARQWRTGERNQHRGAGCYRARRCSDGQQYPLSQFQGREPARPGLFYDHPCLTPGLCLAVSGPAAGAVFDLSGLCDVRAGRNPVSAA